MKKRWLGAGGYLTVEASLIMPIVLYVCIAIIYLGFFQYDRCLMRQDAYRAALKGSSAFRDDNQRVFNTAYEKMEELASEKYMATSCDYKITVQDKVSVLVEGSVHMPFRGIAGFVKASEWTIREKAESKCINPVIFIRTCRQIEKKRNNK